jgi:hypothetical protein
MQGLRLQGVRLYCPNIMSTLTEVEAIVPKFTVEELAELEKLVQITRRQKEQATKHSLLDLPRFSVGGILRPLSSDDDLLGEMLEERKL